MKMFKAGTVILAAGIAPLLVWSLVAPLTSSAVGGSLVRGLALVATMVGGAAIALGLVQWFVARLRD